MDQIWITCSWHKKPEKLNPVFTNLKCCKVSFLVKYDGIFCIFWLKTKKNSTSKKTCDKRIRWFKFRYFYVTSKYKFLSAMNFLLDCFLMTKLFFGPWRKQSLWSKRTSNSKKFVCFLFSARFTNLMRNPLLSRQQELIEENNRWVSFKLLECVEIYQSISCWMTTFFFHYQKISTCI